MTASGRTAAVSAMRKQASIAPPDSSAVCPVAGS